MSQLLSSCWQVVGFCFNSNNLKWGCKLYETMQNKIQNAFLGSNVNPYYTNGWVNHNYTGTHPRISIRKHALTFQVSGYSRTHRAVNGVGSRFSTTVIWSVFPANVWKRKQNKLDTFNEFTVQQMRMLKIK